MTSTQVGFHVNAVTSSQQCFLTGHAGLAHDNVGFKMSSSHARQRNRTNVPPSQRARQSFFISIVVVVRAVALAIVIVAVAGWGWHLADRSTAGFGTDC
jgi:hypothetical protein